MLSQRVITAALVIPLLIASIQWGGEILFIFIVLLVAGTGLYELFRVSLPDETPAERALGIGLGVLILVSVFVQSQIVTGKGNDRYFLTLAGCAFSIFILFLNVIVTADEMTEAIRRLSLKVFGIFYICLFFSYLILLRSGAHGPSLVLFLLLVTWLGDTGSYLVGSWIGKHPLCLAISPKKTVEGAVGGFMCGILAAAVCNKALFSNVSLVSSVIAGAGINIMNQLGDLSESVIKRAYGIKDSGGIFPGHGGVLDRVDSLLFAAPMLFYCSAFLFPA